MKEDACWPRRYVVRTQPHEAECGPPRQTGAGRVGHVTGPGVIVNKLRQRLTRHILTVNASIRGLIERLLLKFTHFYILRNDLDRN